MTPDYARFFARLDLTQPEILAALEAALARGYTALINAEGDLHFYDVAGEWRGFLDLDPLAPTAEVAVEEDR